MRCAEFPCEDMERIKSEHGVSLDAGPRHPDPRWPHRLLETDDHLLIFDDEGIEIMKHRRLKPGTEYVRGLRVGF